jgi:hypothetical protein
MRPRSLQFDTKSTSHKGNSDKLDSIKIKSENKNFTCAQDPFKRMKRQGTTWEEIFARKKMCEWVWILNM